MLVQRSICGKRSGISIFRTEEIVQVSMNAVKYAIAATTTTERNTCPTRLAVRYTCDVHTLRSAT